MATIVRFQTYNHHVHTLSNNLNWRSCPLISIRRYSAFQQAKAQDESHMSDKEARQARFQRWQKTIRTEFKRHERFAKHQQYSGRGAKHSSSNKNNNNTTSHDHSQWKKHIKKSDGTLKNYYETLGVAESNETTQQDIRAAYYALNKLLHPDARIKHSKETINRLQMDDATADKRLIEAQDAYYVLSSRQRRTEYDMELRLEKIGKMQDTDELTQDDMSNIFEKNVHRSYFMNPNTYAENQFRREILYSNKMNIESRIYSNESDEEKERRKNYLNWENWQNRINSKKIQFNTNGTKGFGNVDILTNKEAKIQIPQQLENIRKENAKLRHIDNHYNNKHKNKTLNDNHNHNDGTNQKQKADHYYFVDKFGRFVKRNIPSNDTVASEEEGTARGEGDGRNTENEKGKGKMQGGDLEFEEMLGNEANVTILSVSKKSVENIKNLNNKHFQSRIRFDDRDSINFEPKGPPTMKYKPKVRSMDEVKKSLKTWQEMQEKMNISKRLAITDGNTDTNTNKNNKKSSNNNNNNNNNYRKGTSLGETISSSFDRWTHITNNDNSDACSGYTSRNGSNNNNMHVNLNADGTYSGSTGSNLGIDAIQIGLMSSSNNERRYQEQFGNTNNMGWNIFVMHILGLTGLASLLVNVKPRNV